MVYIDRLSRKRQIMKRRRDQSDCTKTALRQKFKQLSEELSPPPGLEYDIIQRIERRNVNPASNFFTGIRFIITPN